MDGYSANGGYSVVLAEQNLFYIFNWLRTSWCDPHPGIYRSFSGVLSNGEVYKDCNLSPNNSHSVVLVYG